MKEITAYKCGFCNKIIQNKKVAERHEKYCKKNPENKAICFDCGHLEKTKNSIYEDLRYEITGYYHTYRCAKLGIEVAPAKAFRMPFTMSLKLIISAKSKMPSECEYFSMTNNDKL